MEWLDDDPFVHDWCLRQYWTPLQAACLLCDARPPVHDGDLDGIAVELDPYLVNHPDEAADFEQDLKRRIETLSATIAANNSGMDHVVPAETVQWAVNNGVVSEKSAIARHLNVRIVSRRGKHWEEERVHILGAALRALADDPDAVVKGSGEIHRRLLAEAVHERRAEYGLRAEGRPTLDTIKETIAEALRKSGS